MYICKEMMAGFIDNPSRYSDTATGERKQMRKPEPSEDFLTQRKVGSEHAWFKNLPYQSC